MRRFGDVLWENIVSFQQNWGLNYLYLECLYLGIPLIHNSEFFEDCGYFYKDFDVDTAVKHIQNLKHHDIDSYKDKCKAKLYLYSDFNKDNIQFFKDRLRY